MSDHRCDVSCGCDFSMQTKRNIQPSPTGEGKKRQDHEWSTSDPTTVRRTYPKTRHEVPVPNARYPGEPGYPEDSFLTAGEGKSEEGEKAQAEVNHTNCGNTCGICVVPDYPCPFTPRPETEGAVCQECEAIMQARHEAEKAELREKNEELESLFALQETRYGRAEDAWRKASGADESVSPDLGTLLDWLMLSVELGEVKVQEAHALRLRVEELEREQERLTVLVTDAVKRAGDAEFKADMIEEGSSQWQERAEAAERRAEEAERKLAGYRNALDKWKRAMEAWQDRTREDDKVPLLANADDELLGFAQAQAALQPKDTP
jgi:hypothetical protein